MTNLLEVVSGYGIEMQQIKSGSGNVFACRWTTSGMGFYLDFGWRATGRFTLHETAGVPVIYVMELRDVSQAAVQAMHDFSIPGGHLIVYDPDEDIQMFSKDLWNLLVFLKRKNEQ